MVGGTGSMMMRRGTPRCSKKSVPSVINYITAGEPGRLYARCATRLQPRSRPAAQYSLLDG